MATNKKSGSGHQWKYTTTGNVTSGTLLIIGSTPAVALETATTGAIIDVESGGEWVLTKKAAASTALTVGGRVYYIATGGVNKVTGLAAAGKLIGFATVAAATGATSGQVALIGGPTVLETQT